MTLTKRIFIATISGMICGFICMALASSDPSQPVALGIKLSILSGRTLMGFIIGISALEMKWWMHGAFIGFISSIPMAVPIYEQPSIFIATIVMGIIYGILIELVITKLFKTKKGK